MGSDQEAVRLNVGCGNRKLAGYVGVDVVARSAADIVAPANRIPLPDRSVDEILAVHLFEHLTPWEAEEALGEWMRLLKPGGLLALEMPDVLKCARNLVRAAKGGNVSDDLTYWGMYGDPRLKDPHMLHRWGWTMATLRPLLEAVGYRMVNEAPTRFHSVGYLLRDFRVEAYR